MRRYLTAILLALAGCAHAPTPCTAVCWLPSGPITVVGYCRTTDDGFELRHEADSDESILVRDSQCLVLSGKQIDMASGQSSEPPRSGLIF